MFGVVADPGGQRVIAILGAANLVYWLYLEPFVSLTVTNREVRAVLSCYLDSVQYKDMFSV